jgi:hypothetical protein
MVPVIIMLKRLSRYPDRNNPKEIKHKFLVQTAIYDTADVSLADFWAAKEAQHKPKEGNPAYLDSRVNCQLIIPDTKYVPTHVSPLAVTPHLVFFVRIFTLPLLLLFPSLS